MGRKILDAHTLREIAVRAVLDPRTVRRYLEGGRVYGSSRIRIERAIAAYIRDLRGGKELLVARFRSAVRGLAT